MPLSLDPALLHKYNVAGPRYTSYPTAVQFNETFTEADYLWQVEHSNQDPLPKPLSIYLHIPFCRSLCYYCGCHKVITQNADKVSRYLASLGREIQLQGGIYDRDREVRQIHFGGGTPTYISTADLRALLLELRANFTSAREVETGIEIDPRTTDQADIEDLAGMGFNRMSFGVQDFDPQVQSAINRLQDRSETLALLRKARACGVESTSVDLIYGLPRQSLASFAATLDDILLVRPDRIALYNYAHLPNLIKSQRLIDEQQLPATAEKLRIFSHSVNALLEAGYCHIGMDHFALPSDSLSRSLQAGSLHRNFQGYATHGDCDSVGMGVSAIGKVGGAFSQNLKSLADYERSLANNHLPVFRGYSCNGDDIIRAWVIQRLMCGGHINYAAFEQAFNLSFRNYFQAELGPLRQLAADGLLVCLTAGLTVTRLGRLFLRNIAMLFDAYLPAENAAVQPLRFSKVL